MNQIEDVVGYLGNQKLRIESIERQLGEVFSQLGTLADRLEELNERVGGSTLGEFDTLNRRLLSVQGQLDELHAERR